VDELGGTPGRGRTNSPESTDIVAIIRELW
jgi:hypothetical protein